MKSEFEIVKEFTAILGLENQTDGSLFIYKNQKKKLALKPDGYYFKDGVTFILDAKAENIGFVGQLEDYLKLEQNPNKIGFKYNGNKFECYIGDKLSKIEKLPKNANYYIENYFLEEKKTLPEVISNFAKKLAKDFRNAKIDKQNNVPFIGAVMLCLKFCKNFEEEIISDTSKKIIINIKTAITKYISDTPINKKQKKEQIKLILEDNTLIECDYHKLLPLISSISNIYNFININDEIGQDTMNSFLKVFRKWNSVDAKEKGEVFTPDHIAQLMYDLSNSSFDNIILDPTCGSGTFLVNSMFKMLNEIKEKPKEEKFALRKNIVENQLIGIEYKMFNVTLAGINMMLHGDGSSNIFKDDCFNKLPDLKNIYDRVLMNPPFSQGVKELTFVLESLENMKEGGICAAIVPITCILSFKPSSKGKDPKNLDLKREILNKHNLLGVVRLPKKLFFRNASVHTALIIIEAHKKYNGKTWRKNFLDDGYIENRSVGRVPHHTKEALENFINLKKEFILLRPEEDWPKYEQIIFSDVQKMDFMKQKLDFILNTKDVKEIILENNGKISLEEICVSDEDLKINKWKLFNINDLFEIESGKDKSDENNLDNKNGKIPLVIASKNHNGIGYYIKKAKKIFDKNCITLVNQGDGASGIAKAHSYDFAATTSVFVLKNKNLNPHINLFISTVMSKLHDLFDYTYSMNNERLGKIQILLPSKNNEPDWEFMEKYIKNEL